MKLIAVLTAAVATAAIMATGAAATPRHHGLRWNQMGLAQKRALVQNTIDVNRPPVRWWLRHRQRFPASAAPYVMCRALGVRAPGAVCVHGQRLAHALVVLRNLDARIAAAALPAHLALWRCIEIGESHGDGVHPGETWASNGTHFNVLQMTDPWYGIDPIGMTYQAIEAYAEKEYAAYGYSRDWLNGQWGQTISPCWSYAA